MNHNVICSWVLHPYGEAEEADLHRGDDELEEEEPQVPPHPAKQSVNQYAHQSIYKISPLPALQSIIFT